jgi:hypothetical protein
MARHVEMFNLQITTKTEKQMKILCFHLAQFKIEFQQLKLNLSLLMSISKILI